MSSFVTRAYYGPELFLGVLLLLWRVACDFSVISLGCKNFFVHHVLVEVILPDIPYHLQGSDMSQHVGSRSGRSHRSGTANGGRKKQTQPSQSPLCLDNLDQHVLLTQLVCVVVCREPISFRCVFMCYTSPTLITDTNSVSNL